MYPIIANFFIKNNRSDYVHLSYYILYILWSCVYHVTIIYSGRSFYVFTMIDYGNLATSYKSIVAFFSKLCYSLVWNKITPTNASLTFYWFKSIIKFFHALWRQFYYSYGNPTGNVEYFYNTWTASLLYWQVRKIMFHNIIKQKRADEDLYIEWIESYTIHLQCFESYFGFSFYRRLFIPCFKLDLE